MPDDVSCTQIRVNRLTVMTLVNRLTVMTLVNRLTVMTLVNRLTVMTLVARLTVMTLVDCSPSAITTRITRQYRQDRSYCTNKQAA